MRQTENTSLFTGKAAVYDSSRPEYPGEALDCIAEQCGLAPGAVVADIGAGTGKFTKQLLARGYRVTAVEPNADMRGALRAALGENPGIQIIAAPAEATTLASSSADAITAAQAFHWFDHAACKTEFARILKSGGKVALLWNNRDPDMELSREFGNLTAKYRKREAVRSDQLSKVYSSFFASHEVFSFLNTQRMNWDGFWNLILSRSYSPLPGEENYAELETAAEKLFDKHQADGFIDIFYKTGVVIGKL
ncbi:MAG: class I SAM-dependent methyltransferase [Oscillospiraceae bacterium]|jgi:ubiquinone/menaquinone biosynthesis C-methylase UbiE|nr:class I SAM-dependent methyltransferase [Oscillospiraceae bacterium]